MKRIFYLIIACVLLFSAIAGIWAFRSHKASEENADISALNDKATVTANKIEHDFGSINEMGGIVKCEFIIKNTGNVPIAISKVTTSCGCTSSDWTKDPIAPGKQGVVKIEFNPIGYSDEFTKSINVFSTGNPQNLKLSIKGNVI